MKTISVIISCFNEEENIPSLYERLLKVFAILPYAYEMIFVDNNSADNSKKILTNLAKKNKKVKVILMSRNFGSPQPSFLAGLSYAQGDAAFLLHGDIQDPPELLPKFINSWMKGYEVVYGVRKQRKGYGIFMNLCYKSFYWIFRKLSYVDMPLQAGDFSLLDRRIVKELVNIGEYDYYLRGLRSFIGFKQIGVSYIRDERKHGRSTESFITSLYWAKELIVNFSFKPLTFISYLAFVVMIFAFIYMVISLFLVLILKNSPSGIPTITILILFLGGVQLLSLSVIAEYIAKIFLEVKRRPRYIIRETINISNKKL